MDTDHLREINSDAEQEHSAFRKVMERKIGWGAGGDLEGMNLL